MCSFRLSSGPPVAVSVESRRVSEGFNPLAGLYKQYQMLIIFGDERDLLWSRIVGEKEYPMMIYPLEVSKEHAQQYFLNLVKEANLLAEQPDFYQVLSKNCLTTLINASPQVRDTIKHDYRFCFPGFSHELLLEAKLIPDEVDQLSECYAVPNTVSKPGEGVEQGRSWSQSLRNKKS